MDLMDQIKYPGMVLVTLYISLELLDSSYMKVKVGLVFLVTSYIFIKIEASYSILILLVMWNIPSYFIGSVLCTTEWY